MGCLLNALLKNVRLWFIISNVCFYKGVVFLFMEKKDNQVKIRLGSLVLMIFSSIFGFSNSLTAFYQMGYSSII